MRLAVKLSLLLAVAVTLPLLLVLGVLLPRGGAALQAQLRQLYAQDARSLALECQKTVLDDLEALSLAARTLRLPELDEETRQQALLLLYKETRGADVIGLFDETGRAVVPAVRFLTLLPDAAGEHEAVSDLGMAAYSHHVPLQAALETGLAIGPVYSIPDEAGSPIPRVVLAAKVPDRSWVLAMELSLRPLVRSILEFKAGENGVAFLVDARNHVIADRDPLLIRDRTDLSWHPLLGGAGERHLLGASAVAPLLGWKVIVQQPAAEALGPLRSTMRGAALWVLVALVLAVATGVVAVRAVTRPVQALHDAARAVAAGSLDVEVTPRGSDEVAQLARMFNAMTLGLRERDEMKLVLSLSSSLDLQEVLHRLLDSLAKVVHFERAAVLVARAEGYELALARGWLDAEEPRLYCPREGAGGMPERAVQRREPLISPAGDVLLLPLLSRENEVAGLIALERHGQYREDDARVAAAFLQPAAVAIDNARLFSEVKRLATTDGLTGISNRRHFLQLGERLFETARRYGQPLSALMLDVDHFKRVNDRHGHAVGDQVLRAIALRCKGCLRSADLLGRYGGEEFAMLLPMTQAEPAQSLLAERIRRAIAHEPFPTRAGPVSITASIGMATLSPAIDSLEALLVRADGSLYEAKAAGRDQVA